VSTGFLSDFAVFASKALHAPFPELARSRAADAITDCIGCMAAGRREALADKLLRALPSSPRQNGQAGMAAMAFTDRMASPSDAALFAGALAHALDFDDSTHPAYAHSSAVLVPTILAASKLAFFSGADAIAGYIVGLEMFGKLARGLNNRHYELGWHTTSTIGSIASAATAATLLGLSRTQIANALNLSTTFAGGLRVHFGTMTKPLHAGMAARNGLLAAKLAQEDFSCSSEGLEHRYGFASVFNGGAGNFDLEAMGRPGEQLEIMTDYGVSLKAFPSCGATHPGIEAATRLHPWLAGRKVRSVRIGVPELSFRPLIYHAPTTPLQGKFSLEFCVAAGLLDGQVRIDTFSQERISSPEVVELVKRSQMEVDERVRHEKEWATAVRVETESGEVREELVPLAIGKVGRWFSEDDLRAKFMDCAGRTIQPAQAERLYAMLRSISALPSFAALETEIMAGAPNSESLH
jgi:2-methylcitrate dehydratase PrpD